MNRELQAYGPSGMTILEELMYAALQACENARDSDQTRARGAAVLTCGGKVFTACDVKQPSGNGGGQRAVCAEVAAISTAKAEGETRIQVIVVGSDYGT
jgi:cytidine deaminase